MSDKVQRVLDKLLSRGMLKEHPSFIPEACAEALDRGWLTEAEAKIGVSAFWHYKTELSRLRYTPRHHPPTFKPILKEGEAAKLWRTFVEDWANRPHTDEQLQHRLWKIRNER